MTDKIASAYSAHFQTILNQTESALRATGHRACVIAAGSAHGMFLDDMDYPFKTNPHFQRWVPVGDAAHSALVIEIGKTPRLLHYRPDDYWHKAPEVPTGFWVDHFDIVSVSDLGNMRDALPEGAAAAPLIAEKRDQFKDWGLGEQNPEGLLNHLHFHRAWKTDYEIACMEVATKKAVKAHRAALNAYQNGASEYEIHQAYLLAAGHVEHELPYGNIIAYGENAAVLHYTHLPRQHPDGIPPSFLIDAGATHNGYASDITRTYTAHGGEFAEMIDAMDEAQIRLCETIKPGLNFADLHLQAHAEVATMLNRFKIVKCSAEAALESGLTRTFLPHGLGHLLGLQVHDIGGLQAGPDGGIIERPDGHPYLRLTRTLETSWVTTVEPGLYFIPSLLKKLAQTPAGGEINWEKVESLKPFGGIRIEDNVLVTENGQRNLTREEEARTA
ncbi:MAG: Xaa-Pro dipeptidase [Chromatiales bacterium]|nr:Xaa-Pro dipeptidase [Chromatiales bacterium]